MRQARKATTGAMRSGARAASMPREGYGPRSSRRARKRPAPSTSAPRRADAGGELAVGGDDAHGPPASPSASTRSAMAAIGRVAAGRGATASTATCRARAARRSRGRPSKYRVTGSPDRRRRTRPPGRRGARAAPARSRHHPSGRAPMTLLPSTIQRTRRMVADRPLRCVCVRTGSMAPRARRCSAARSLALSCGGSRTTTAARRYVEQVNEAQRDFAARVDELSKGVTATSSAARDRRTLRSFEEAVDEVGGELREHPPARGGPRAARAPRSRAVDGYGDEVQQAARTLETSKSASQLRGAQRGARRRRPPRSARR